MAWNGNHRATNEWMDGIGASERVSEVGGKDGEGDGGRVGKLAWLDMVD